MPAHSDVEQSTVARACRSPKAWTLLLGVLALSLVLDLGTKAVSFQHVAGRPVVLDRQQLLQNPHFNPIPYHEGIHILPWNLLELQLVINYGAVFGMGQNQRFFFIFFTLGALTAGLFVFGRFTHADDRLAHFAIALILAGGIGNLFDRIVFGVVRDFMHLFPEWHLPFGWTWWGGSPELFPWVFNCADTMLLTGMGLLMLHMSRVERRRKLAHQAAADSSNSIAAGKSSKSAFVSGDGKS